MEKQVVGQRDTRQDRCHKQLTRVVFPPVGQARYERQDRDHGEQNGEWDDHRHRGRGAGLVMLARCVVAGLVVGRVIGP